MKPERGVGSNWAKECIKERKVLKGEDYVKISHNQTECKVQKRLREARSCERGWERIPCEIRLEVQKGLVKDFVL